VKGTNKGTTTDADGKFNLDVNPGEVLVVSSVGFGSKEVPILSAQSNLVIALDISSSPLDEVQIIAYGEASRRLNTGNVSSVKGADIAKQPVQNPLLALQARVPGIFIEQATGLPGGGVKVRVQGQNSISNRSDPLYVIDGVPYSSQLLRTINPILGSSGATDENGFSLFGNPLSYINPADIERIDILKDADATSIYGSRAANGAILITTKRGKFGQTKIDLNIQNGWGKVSRKLDLLNLSQYMEMRKEAYTNDGMPVPGNSTTPSNDNYDLTVWDDKRFTDWQNELIGGTAKYTNAQLSVSGGSANTQF
jgi:TonB-dependent SusC/RagA subfamily outer membrane receptor